MYAICFTVTAAGATEVYLPGVITMGGNSATTGASSSNTGTGSPAAMSIDDGSPGTNSMRFVGQYYGGTALTTGANTTAGPTFLPGSLGVWGWRQTTASQGSVAIGSSTTTADDRATVGLAIREIPPKGIPFPRKDRQWMADADAFSGVAW
jgi:hypothetical protein